MVTVVSQSPCLLRGRQGPLPPDPELGQGEVGKPESVSQSTVTLLDRDQRRKSCLVEVARPMKGGQRCHWSSGFLLKGSLSVIGCEYWTLSGCFPGKWLPDKGQSATSGCLMLVDWFLSIQKAHKANPGVDKARMSLLHRLNQGLG